MIITNISSSEDFAIQYKDYLFENFFNKRYLLSIIVIILASGYFIKPSIIKYFQRYSY